VRRRLARSHLLRPAPHSRLVDVVSGVCGIQAQVMGAAELALSVRVKGLERDDVRAALWEHRTLAKTWTIRGTLHLHPAGELPLWTAARRAVNPSWHEGYGLSKREGERVLDAIADALDGRTLLREELAEEVARRAGEWAREPVGSGWGYLIGDAAAVGKLCHGPPQGNKVTFVRTDQWVGWDDFDPQEALVEAARRFLEAYGPAGPREFAEWFGMNAPEARRLFQSIRATRKPRSAAHRPAPARLLPEYDCYVMGFRERDRLLPARVRAKIQAHPRGRYESVAAVPTLLVDGVVAGVWKRSRGGKQVVIAVEPARRLTPSERSAVEQEAERIGGFLGLEPVLRLGKLGESP
jgi:hypothetical protein